jgi:ABC-type multidrug transport system permease subunit
MADENSSAPPPKNSPWWLGWLIVLITSLIFSLLYGVGAAKLAYDRSGSALFALIAFFLSPLYYPYYAFTQPAPTVMGAARKLKGMF